MRILVEPPSRIGDADPRQHLRRSLAQLGFGGLRPLGPLQLDQLVADGEHRIERRHRVLKDHGEAGAAQRHGFRHRQIQQIAAIEFDRAVEQRQIGRQQPQQAGGERRFA